MRNNEKSNKLDQNDDRIPDDYFNYRFQAKTKEFA